MKQLTYTFLFSIAVCLLASCKHPATNLETVLQLSGDNRAELERVLGHYPEDSEKAEAARFLVANLMGNMAYDTTALQKYRPLLLRYDSLKRQEEAPYTHAKEVLNREWKRLLRYTDPRATVHARRVPDWAQLSADYLIEDIDLAFRIREQCLYKDSVRQEDFLKYVLPYRRNNGYAIEAWRRDFWEQYGEYATQYASPRELVDSLLEQFNDYQVDWSDITGYPYVCLQDYRLTRISRCPERCWFNSMLLAALGIPCTIDYVPAWGNRNSSHEWNAVVINGKTYPFEATGGRGKWKAGKVYNNVWVDAYWMKSRLPKVFRYSYETRFQGPAADPDGSADNTPPLFLNCKYEDVSEQYFTTSDVHIPIPPETGRPKEKYAYLCVFNEDVWKPVYWGKVEGKGVTFQRMGRDIVYLPVFYREGRIVPFNNPFLLRADGSVHFLQADCSQTVDVTLERKYYARPDIGFWCEWNQGARFEVADRRDFATARPLFTVPACKSHPNVWPLDTVVKCRYIRYVFPEHKDVLAELSYYAKDADTGAYRKLSGTPFAATPQASQALEALYDNDLLTYAQADTLVSKEDSTVWAGMDFGSEIELAALGVCPRNDKNDVIQGMEYELFYWHGAWQSLGRKVANRYAVNYDAVPSNALLLLKCTTEGRENRIFTWEEGKQVWW